MPNLAECKIGQKVTVNELLAEGKAKHRLIEMGVHVGAELIIKKFAPLGDPMEIALKDFSIALRRADAKKIIVK